MTAPFTRIVNNQHDQKVLVEQQDQAIRMVANSRRKETPAKKASWLPELVLALVLVVAVGVAFYMATAEHRGAPSIDGTPVSEMSISAQLDAMEEVRYNDN